ncbi:MAG: F0F1 ATP synthase subunit B' [Hyphomicrobiaceae bacterium]
MTTLADTSGQATTAGSTALDAATTAAHGTAEAAGGHGGGLPQLNPDVFQPQLIWLALTFAALYFLLTTLVLPRIRRVLEERAGRIRRDLDEAARLKDETKKAMEAYEQALADARGQAHKLAQDTRDTLKADMERERARVDKEVGDRIAGAESQIAAARTKALGEVGTIAAETAEAIVEQLIGVKISRDEAAKAVGSVGKGR